MREHDPLEHCVTCADEGIEMRVIEVRDDVAICAGGDLAAPPAAVAVDLVGPLVAGDLLLVHAGVAIGQLAR